MVFPVVGGDGKPTGYEIENSLRFNETDNSKLVFDPDGAEDTQTMTLSFWMKVAVSDFGGDHDNIFSVRPGGGSYTMLVLRTTGRLMFEDSSHGGNLLRTNRLFRDPSAWYHIVLAIDSTQGTAANRIKLYVNGVEETSFETDNRSNLTQNGNLYWGGGHPHQVVGDPTGNYHYGGYLAEMHFVPGSQLTPSSFGETNDNGVWIPKKYTGSHGDGTGGFYLEFKQTGTSANASGIGADTSGGTNHFTPTNLAATDVTTDTPTNNFCTMNPLISFAGASDGIDAFSEGNTVVDSNNDTSAAGATFGVQNGKWYYEAKLTTGNQSSTNFGTGWASTNYEDQKGTGNGVGFMSGEDNIAVDPGGNLNKGGTGSTQVFGNRSTNDIFQVAIDLDNGKIWFGVNGTWSNGSATNSTTLDASNPDYSSVFDTVGEHYMPAFGQGSSGQTVLAYNFGNPAFSISSGNADANGYGNFEYEVPSGFYSLCTKNLAEFG